MDKRHTHAPNSINAILYNQWVNIQFVILAALEVFHPSNLPPAQRTAGVELQMRKQTVDVKVVRPTIHGEPPIAILIALANGTESLLQHGPAPTAEQAPHEDERPANVDAQPLVQRPGAAAGLDHAQRAADHPVQLVQREPGGAEPLVGEAPHKVPDGVCESLVFCDDLLHQRVAEQAARGAVEGLEAGVVGHWRLVGEVVVGFYSNTL